MGQNLRRRAMMSAVLAFAGAAMVALFVAVAPLHAADEIPKRGGTLTYIIPADAPPSFDGHREETFATIHAVAPFYSLLIRVDPQNPGSGQFVCDLCTDMPKPADDGKTYTFKIRDGVKFHDGSPLTAADVAASWNEIIFPPQGVVSTRQSYFMMVDKVEAPDPATVVFRLKFATGAFLPALADPLAFIYQKAQLDKDPHWYERNINGTGPFSLTAVGSDYLACGAARRMGTCSNHRSVRRGAVEGIILDALKNCRTSPELVATFIDEFHRELNRQRQGAPNARDGRGGQNSHP